MAKKSFLQWLGIATQAATTVEAVKNDEIDTKLVVQGLALSTATDTQLADANAKLGKAIDDIREQKLKIRKELDRRVLARQLKARHQREAADRGLEG